MDMVIIAVVLFFCLLLVVMIAYLSGKNSRITRVEKDVEELKKKEESGSSRVNDLKEFAVAARLEINTLSEATKAIQAGFEKQEQRRMEVLNEIKALIPSAINSALEPLRVEIRNLKEESKK